MLGETKCVQPLPCARHFSNQCNSLTQTKCVQSFPSARHFSNWCDIYKVVKVVHRNQLDDHCNWSDT